MNGTPLLPVAPDEVGAILLADGWHKVALGSFTVGALDLGDGVDCGVLGYRFEEISNGSLHHQATLAGPLNAVLAVRQVTSRTAEEIPAMVRGAKTTINNSSRITQITQTRSRDTRAPARSPRLKEGS